METFEQASSMDVRIERPSSPETQPSDLSRFRGVLRGRLKQAVAFGVLVGSVASQEANAGPIELDTVDGYYIHWTAEVLVDASGGNTLYGFIKKRLKDSGQLPEDESVSEALINAFIKVCRQENPDYDLDNFSLIEGQSLEFPQSVTVRKEYSAHLPSEKDITQFRTITVPAGMGFLWIQKNYGVTEAEVRKLNPQLEGRGLHKGEVIRIPAKN